MQDDLRLFQQIIDQMKTIYLKIEQIMFRFLVTTIESVTKILSYINNRVFILMCRVSITLFSPVL